MKILLNSQGILNLKKEIHEMLNSTDLVGFDKALCKQHNAIVVDIKPIDYECIKFLTLSDLDVIEGVYTLNDLFEEKCALKREYDDIIQWFYDTDYIPHKIVRDEWTKEDERYVQYIEEYTIKHARKEEIEALLML